MVRRKKVSKTEDLEQRVEKFLRHPHLPDSWVHQKLKLSHRHHTAKVLPRHHTSYGVLLLMLLLSGWMVVILGKSALAGPPQSQSGSISVGGQVVGPPPSDPAVITQPTNGQHFISTPIIVKGTCTDNVFVEIHRNGIYAGSTTCSTNIFELSIDLVTGQNELIAKVSDEFDQYGPDSDMVSVTYQPATTPSTGTGNTGTGEEPSTNTSQTATGSAPSSSIPQLLVSTDSRYKGVLVGRSLTFKFRITGGEPPYAAVVEWGDEKQDVVSKPNVGEVSVEHIYERGGTYNIKVNVSDKAGRKSFLQTVIIIVGDTTGSVKAIPVINYIPQLYIVAWPLYILLIFMISMFWLGERYEFYRLRKYRNT